MELKASVNKNACIGCGICIDICPSVFEFDPQAISEASTIMVNPSVANSAKKASDACPTSAISLF